MKKPDHIEQLTEFLNFLHAFLAVEREFYIKDFPRKENDGEHSFQLAMMAWYIIDVYHLAFDKQKILMYALAHDLVEVYAGDTYAFTHDQSLLITKQTKEAAAAKKIQKTFPEFIDLHKAIRAYEKKEDDEAIFVYALDKIVPVLCNFLDKGRTWQMYGITYEELLENKAKKISLSPDVQRIWDLLIPLLKEHQDYFGKKA